MNPENTIKSLIPQPIIDNILSRRREEAAGIYLLWTGTHTRKNVFFYQDRRSDISK